MLASSVPVMVMVYVLPAVREPVPVTLRVPPVSDTVRSLFAAPVPVLAVTVATPSVPPLSMDTVMLVSAVVLLPV